MPQKMIRSKSRIPSSLQYNAWTPIHFPAVTLSASEASSTIAARIPLGLNFKITHIGYVLSGSPAGTLALNVVEGSGVYEGTGAAASYATLTLGGTFAAGDTIVYVIGGVSTTYTVSARNAGNNQAIAAAMATSFNRTNALNVSYRLSSLGAILVVQTLAYSTATPTFTASVVSAAGTATASGATFTAGVAGTLPVAPASDSTLAGVVPSVVAASLTALFPVDMFIPTSLAEQVGTIYALENFDAIFPTCSELTLRVVTNGAGAGTLQVTLYGVPVDRSPMQPEEANSYFHLSQTIL